MKKLFYLTIAAALSFGLASCTSTEEQTALNFEKCWNEAYQDMLKDQPDTSFHFYYAQALLNKNINEISTSQDVELTEVEVLFQKDSAHITRYIYTPDGNVDKSTFDGTWLECMVINPAEVGATLSEAIDLIGAMDCIKPSSNIVVMRCPLVPPFNVHPYYIFGTADCFISINSVDDFPIDTDETAETVNEDSL